MTASFRTFISWSIKQIILAAVILCIGRIIANTIANVFYRLVIVSKGRDERSEKVAHIIRRIVKVTILSFICLAALNTLGMNVTLLMWWLTFAIGYAMEELIGNMFGGLMLMTNPKYKIGDIVQVLSPINAFGTIEAINVRNTTLRSFDKRTRILPNMLLLRTPLKTFNAEELIRYKLEISIPRKENFEKIKKLIIHSVNSHPQVVQHEHTKVTINSFNEQGTLLDIYFFDNPQTIYSSFSLRSEVRDTIYRTLNKAGISIPFPKRVLVGK